LRKAIDSVELKLRLISLYSCSHTKQVSKISGRINITKYFLIYFNKVHCFCFEEQKFSPGEEMDMPVQFFIDPDFDKDPLLKNLNEITLSYTFFVFKK
jgi:hypothetical protein